MTSSSTLVLRTALGTALCAVSLPAAAGPSMSTSLQSTTLELAECLQRGEASLREAGMTRNLQVM